MSQTTTPPFHKTRPLRIFVFFSGYASSIRYLKHYHPEYNQQYTIVGALTDNRNAPGIEFFNTHTNITDTNNSGEKKSIPCIVLDWKTFRKEQGKEKRVFFFEVILEKIATFKADIILCAGFRRIISDSFIEDCGIRILNDHPADLSILSSDGVPIYAGDGFEAIKRTILDGRNEIRSTVHWVTTGPVDSGPIICQSPIARIEPHADPEIVRQRIKSICSGPAIAKALKMIVDGEISLEK